MSVGASSFATVRADRRDECAELRVELQLAHEYLDQWDVEEADLDKVERSLARVKQLLAGARHVARARAATRAGRSL